MATQVSLNSGAVASAGALALQTNGTTQAVSISTGQVATLAQNPVLTSGTENGVAYLNGSKVLTTGSGLTFDGTTFQTTGIVAGNSAQFTGANAPSTGAGIELLYTGTVAKVQAYNRTGSAYLPLTIEGSYIPFNISGAEAMRLTSTSLYTASGINVGIGTSSPAYKLDVSTSGTTTIRSISTANGDIGRLLVASKTSGAVDVVGVFASEGNASDVAIGTTSNHPIVFLANNGEKMRLDSSGNLLVGGTTSLGSSARVQVTNPAGNAYGFSTGYSSTAGQFRQIYLWSADDSLRFDNGTNVASLSTAGAWTNASDARIKKNIVDIKYGLTDVLKTKPRSYEMIDVAGEYIGFVAQELQTIIPEVVSGDPEKQLGVDYGSLVALAFKAIQEQQAIIQSLTARITALEGA